MLRKLLFVVLFLACICSPAGAQKRPADDVANVASEDLRAEGDENKRYFLIGPKQGATAPANGYGLVVVLPGGDGGPGFHPFVKRIFKYALNGDYLVAQPVAVRWTPRQQVIWPTGKTPVRGQKFSTEEFVETVIRDVAAKHTLNRRHVFTLAWSSGGPPAYAISLRKQRPVTGSFIAMSVFRTDWLPPLAAAKGHVYLLYHSPKDKVCPFRMAKAARNALERHGAKVSLVTYPGGHGWRGAVFDNIRAGIEWLERAVPKVTVSEAEPGQATGVVLMSDGFESGGQSPDGWTKGVAVEGVEYVWDKGQAFEGDASLAIRKEVQRFWPTAQWSRNILLKRTPPAIVITLRIKAVAASKAAVDVQFLDLEDKWIKHEWAAYVGAKEIGEPPVSHDWKEYSGTVEVPPGTKQLRIALQVYGPGAVWFDALTVRAVDGNAGGQ